MNQPHVYMDPFFFGSPSLSVHHRAFPVLSSSYLSTKLLPQIHCLLFSFFSFNFCFQRSHSFSRFHCCRPERGQVCVSLFLSFTTSPVNHWVFPPKCPAVSLNTDVKNHLSSPLTLTIRISVCDTHFVSRLRSLED